jgi:hypothetical protein
MPRDRQDGRAWESHVEANARVLLRRVGGPALRTAVASCRRRVDAHLSEASEVQETGTR